MKEFTKKVYRFLGSKKFFVAILIFFVFESVWIALSATYPQAFDENFHFGLIQVYSHHLSPFLSSQPANSNAYGAVARDPSYLYHYLMSFPYRVINLFTHEVIGQVIVLRIVNVGLFAVGLVLFRKILTRVGISKPLANSSILIFALIPIVPQLAAQINYDNMLFPLTAFAVLLTFDVIDQIKAKKPSIRTFTWLISLCLLTSIVKYAFLPIFLAIILFVAVIVFRNYRHNFKKLGSQLWTSWKKQTTLFKVILIGTFIISAGMFAQRDIVNVVKYHAIAPDCNKVLSVTDCSAYSPWYFNYVNHQNLQSQKQSGSNDVGSPAFYTSQWVYWMWYRLFFAVNGPNTSFTNYPPLPLPSAAAIILGTLGVVLTLKYWRTIFKNNIYLTLLFFVTLFYIGALFLQGYSTYHYTNVLENMNGRYLLPVLLLIGAIFGRAISLAFKNYGNIKTIMVLGMLVLFIEGGGLLTFIARSDDSWDVQNSVVQKVNDTTRNITNPVVVNGSKQYTSNYWFFN